MEENESEEYGNFDENGKRMRPKEWAEYFNRKDRFKLQTKVNDLLVSTVYVGALQKSKIYETSVFNKIDGKVNYSNRYKNDLHYETKEDAIYGHNKVLERISLANIKTIKDCEEHLENHMEVIVDNIAENNVIIQALNKGREKTEIKVTQTKCGVAINQRNEPYIKT